MWYECTKNPLASQTVALTASPDGPLTLSRRRLDNAVHALADPIPVWADGVCRWSDSVYVRLRGALRGAPVTRAAVYRRSKPPCRFDVLALLVSIDAAVCSWEPDAKNTVERLHHLAGRGWRPQDCTLIDTYSGEIERWTLSAGELLTPELRVFLREPCPRCGERWAVRRDSAGELVRVRALKVSETGCRCQVCGAFWGPDRLEWLARLLGCPALPA
jgi:hypothetical protein